MDKPGTPSLRRHGGFTLVELLIVVAIVAVLLALAIPIVGRMRESSRAAICASNMRQIHTAFIQCAWDRNGYLIPADSGSEPRNGLRANIRWYQSQWEGVLAYASPLADYLGNETLAKVTICPCNAELFTYHTVYGRILKSRYGWPYPVNYSVIVSSGRVQDGKVVKLTDVKNASQTALLSDGGREDDWGTGWEGSFVPHPNQSKIGEPHSGRGNVIWMDGHVSMMTREELVAHIAEGSFK